MISSFFTCYPSAASISRSSVIEGAGAKTMVCFKISYLTKNYLISYFIQLSGAFSGVVLFFVILFMGPLFKCLPNAVLASVIVAAFKSILLQALDMFRLWKINKYESVRFPVSLIIWVNFKKNSFLDSLVRHICIRSCYGC